MKGLKSGIDYFPFDVDFFEDDKLQFVSARFGCEGEIITIRLLCKIYKNGYFTPWGDDECLLFSKKSGLNPDVTKEIVAELLKRNFFCQDLFEKYGILTSNGIQRRFLEITRRRKLITIQKEYIIADITEYNVNILTNNVDIFAQSKVKESKVKESKERKYIKEKMVNYSENFKDTFNEFAKMRDRVKRPLTDRAIDLSLKELDKLATTENEKIAILNQSTLNSWQGLFPLKNKDSKGSVPVKRNYVSGEEALAERERRRGL